MKLIVKNLKRLTPKCKLFHSTRVVMNSFVEKQNEIFNNECTRQYNKIGRIEKIDVKYLGSPAPCKLSLNKSISTPFNAAQHMNEWVMKQSAMALVDKQRLWDMHRPLEADCELQFLTFTDADPYHVNKAFWRTCSFLLGAIIKEAFSSDVKVNLHSFPSPQITSGSFVHDASLSLESWHPTMNELRILSAQMVMLSQKELPIERLQVSENVAKNIFADNHFKLHQIPDIADNAEGKVTLYRVGSHIDISKGPMIANTSFIGRCSLTAVHQIEKGGEKLFRFQGVALPQGILLNHFAYKILEERASKLNTCQTLGYMETKLEQMSH